MRTAANGQTILGNKLPFQGTLLCLLLTTPACLGFFCLFVCFTENSSCFEKDPKQTVSPLVYSMQLSDRITLNEFLPDFLMNASHFFSLSQVTHSSIPSMKHTIRSP